MSAAVHNLRRRIKMSIITLFSLIAVSGTIFVFETFAQPHGGTVATSAESVTSSTDTGGNRAIAAFIAAAAAFGLGAIGAGLAISSVGAAAMGAVAEKPEIAGQALIFVALAEGLVVFGFIMGLLILGKV